MERTACRDPKDIQDVKGTEAEGGTRAIRENRACRETRDIQDTEVAEVLLGAEA